MALIRRWKPEPWTPTPAQEATALRLADSLVASRARTLADGTAELQTIENGEVRRYVIYQDGTAMVLESRPLSAAYRRMNASRTVVGWVATAALVWLIVAQAVDFHEETLGWVAAVLFVSFMGLFASEVAMNREVDPPGEQWQRVGGGEF